MIHFNLLLQIFSRRFLLRSGAQIYLSWLNISYLRQHGTTVPEIFQDIIDPEKLKKISAYTVDSENFSMVATLAQPRTFPVIFALRILNPGGETISLWKIRTDCEWFDFLCCSPRHSPILTSPSLSVFMKRL